MCCCGFRLNLKAFNWDLRYVWQESYWCVGCSKGPQLGSELGTTWCMVWFLTTRPPQHLKTIQLWSGFVHCCAETGVRQTQTVDTKLEEHCCLKQYCMLEHQDFPSLELRSPNQDRGVHILLAVSYIRGNLAGGGGDGFTLYPDLNSSNESVVIHNKRK